MFRIDVINVLGELESHYWMNKPEDDFLQFLPKQFGVPKENISVYMLDEDGVKEELEAYVAAKKDEEAFLDFSEGGKIKIKYKEEYEEDEEIDVPELDAEGKEKKNADGSTKMKKEIVTVKKKRDKELKAYQLEKIDWPYDSKGKFLGHKKSKL